MSVPEPSMDLNKWDLVLLDQLINYPAIEGETFDFKGTNLSGLEIHICAMANTSGGILALGIEEPAVPGQPFVKSGFDLSRKNSILNDVRNYTYMVEPHPKIETWPIDDPANGRFYLIVKVHKTTDLPYAIKNKGIFYVRVGASSSPASPSTVLNLFSDIKARIRDVDRLKSSCLATRNSFIQISRIIAAVSDGKSNRIPPLDLSFLKNATIQAEWFLLEKGLLGEIDENGHRSGMYTHLHSLEQMNSYIDGFNSTNFPTDKGVFRKELMAWAQGHGAYNATIPFLEGVIKQCEKFFHEKGGDAARQT